MYRSSAPSRCEWSPVPRNHQRQCPASMRPCSCHDPWQLGVGQLTPGLARGNPVLRRSCLPASATSEQNQYPINILVSFDSSPVPSHFLQALSRETDPCDGKTPGSPNMQGLGILESHRGLHPHRARSLSEPEVMAPGHTGGPPPTTPPLAGSARSTYLMNVIRPARLTEGSCSPARLVNKKQL